MVAPIDPRANNFLTGYERVLNPAAFKAGLLLGTMADQNANNVAISGGTASLSSANISNLSANYIGMYQINGSYYYGSYSYISYMFPTYLNVGSSSFPSQNFHVEGNTGFKQGYYNTPGQISPYETVILCDASTGGSCTGTATDTCDTWQSADDCNARSNHGGCGWNSVYCPNYNNDPTNCAFYHCTVEENDCGNFSDQYSCDNYSGGHCSWNPDLGPCSNYNSDSYGCNNYTSGGCAWVDAVNGNCADISDPTFCNENTGGSCSWGGGSTGTPCSVYNGDPYNCNNSTMGTCSYVDTQYGDCSTFNGDQSSCEGHGCSWDFDFSTCSGMYVVADAYCGGGFFGGTSDFCQGGMYTITPAYCGGSGYPLGTGSCTGGMYQTGNCNSSGVEGYCSGTPNCENILDSGYCAGETGCSFTAGVTLKLPMGYQDSWLHLIKDDETGNPCIFVPYPDSGQTIRGGGSLSLTSSIRSAILSFRSAVSDWKY